MSSEVEPPRPVKEHIGYPKFSFWMAVAKKCNCRNRREDTKYKDPNLPPSRNNSTSSRFGPFFGF